jgi:hypothetical protein
MILVAFAPTLASPCQGLQAGDEADVRHFEANLRPVLVDRCFTCHGPDEQKGGLRIDSRQAMLDGGESGPAIVPGKPDESLLLSRILAGEMPQGKPPLSAGIVADLRRWVEAGAPMAESPPSPSRPSDRRDHWAFKPPSREAAVASLPAEARPWFERRPALAGIPAAEPNEGQLESALEAWYRAEDLSLDDGATVDVWPDRSGRGRSLRPTRGTHPNGLGSAPTYCRKSAVCGSPAVHFDDQSGLGSPGDNPLPILADAPYTLCMVFNLSPRIGGFPHDLLLSFGEFAWPDDPGRSYAGAIGIQRGAGAHHRLAVVGGWGHDAVFPSGSMASLYYRPCILTVVKSPGPMARTTRVYVNGELVDGMAGWGPPAGSNLSPDLRPRQSADFSVMMGNAVSGAGGFRGDVAEVLLYSAAIEDGSRMSLEAGLARRYGIESTALRPGVAGPPDDRGSVFASQHPIDWFLRTALQSRHLSSAPQADRPTLARRASFDLLGLPPTPEQADEFVRDSSPFAWEAFLADLLASPHYGERWARHWLDVARYADSGGYETDVLYRNAWRYRDYVVKSFNDDKPYDRFVQEQVAGDLLWQDDLELDGSTAVALSKLRSLEARTGTGFYCLGPQVHESNMDARKLDYERLTDWADVTGAAFLGVTLGCARCHDHKFDPFTQQDYFGLCAVFADSRETDLPIFTPMEVADYKQHYPRVWAVAAARNAYRQFEKSLSGRSPTAEEQVRLDGLRMAIGRAVLDLPERATSSPNTPFDGVYDVPCVTVLEQLPPDASRPVHLLHRGDLDSPRDRAFPALPQVLAEATQSEARFTDGVSPRQQLALWLTRADHPLTARVIVNRVWQWHFGTGLVSTENDFGRMGQPPSHPELLDYLATELVRSGWSLKRLHLLIMTSAAYQQSSRFCSEAHLQADADNRLIWRFNRRRLEGEAVWDAIQYVSGSLNLKLGGPPVFPPLSDEELAPLRERYRWIVSSDPDQQSRRGLYVMTYRNFRFPLFEMFDAPTSAVSAPGRETSTVAPQALWLLNNQASWGQARLLAARCVRKAGLQPELQVDRLWRLALGRAPTDEERAEALNLVSDLAETSGEGGLEGLPPELAGLPPDRARALITLAVGVFNHNEFLFID